MNIRIHSYIAVYINKADINHLSDCSLFHSCSLSCTFIIFYLVVSFVVFVMSFAPVCLMYYLFYFFCTYYISDIDNMQFFKCSGFYYYSFYRTVLWQILYLFVLYLQIHRRDFSYSLSVCLSDKNRTSRSCHISPSSLWE